MSKLEIDLAVWREEAMNDDPWDIAGNDIEVAAEWIFLMLDEQALDRTSTLEDKLHAMRKHPELVYAHATAHAINRIEHTYRTMKIEELRLKESIAISLERIASAMESTKGKRDE